MDKKEEVTVADLQRIRGEHPLFQNMSDEVLKEIVRNVRKFTSFEMRVS